MKRLYRHGPGLTYLHIWSGDWRGTENKRWSGTKAARWGQWRLCALSWRRGDAQELDSTTGGESLCRQRMWCMARRSREGPAPPLLLTPPLWRRASSSWGRRLRAQLGQASRDMGTRSRCPSSQATATGDGDRQRLGSSSSRALQQSCRQTLAMALYFIGEIVGLGTIFLIKTSGWDSGSPHQGEFSIGHFWDFLSLFFFFL